MSLDVIEQSLRFTYSVPDDSRLDVEMAEDGAYRATEVRPDLSTGRRFSGTLQHGGPFSTAGIGITSAEEPDLTLAQLPLWETIHRDWSEKVRVAEEDGNSKVLLMRDGEYPELFPSLAARPMNIAGNVDESMKEVWFALDHMLRDRGWLVSRQNKGGGPCELWACR